MIKRDLSEIIQKQMRDPRLALISVTDVDVARDFSVAKVFISVVGTPEEKAAALKALQGAAGFLRGHLGKLLELRNVPALAFRYDTGIERGARMYELLRNEERAIAEDLVPGSAEEAARYVHERKPEEEKTDENKTDENKAEEHKVGEGAA